jgi:hypothetical protein
VTSQPAEHPLIAAARAWYDAGFAVIPCHEDGSKRPFGPWRQYQLKRPDWQTVREWLESGRFTGIGVLMGAASQNTEMAELEGPLEAALQRLERVMEHARQAGFADLQTADLIARIWRGCSEQSAGGGIHLFIRVIDGPAKGNTKLAHAGQGPNRKVIAETRGEGGFVVVAPTTARNGHEPGTAYLFLRGSSPAGVVEVTSEERDLLYAVIQSALDEADTPSPITVPGKIIASTTEPGAFDEYRQRTTWREILAPAGWREGFTDADGRTHWTRPGGDHFEGTSATTLEDGPLYVFSTNAGLPTEQGLSKATVYALLHHDGDLSAARRELLAQGFSPTLPEPPEIRAWEPEAPDVAHDDDEETDYDRAVRRKYSEMRIAEDARELLARHKTGQAPDLSAIALDNFLAQPDEDITYRINELWPSEGRVLLAAAAKTGKTTLVAANLIPSITDQRPFLGRAIPAPLTDGRTIVYLNMEVGEGTLRRWMRSAGITNTDRVIIGNLRGKASALQLGSGTGRTRFAAWLRDHGAEMVVLDPLAPVLASLGLDENSNAEVARFFGWWAETMQEAGVSDDMIVHHIGHAGERSRGASRLLDEPDAIWTLTKQQGKWDDSSEFAELSPARFLSAYGRDVDLPEKALQFDPETKALELTEQTRSAVKTDKIRHRIVHLMSDGNLRNKDEICRSLGGNRNPIYTELQKMESDKLLVLVPGLGRKLKFEGPDDLY